MSRISVALVATLFLSFPALAGPINFPDTLEGPDFVEVSGVGFATTLQMPPVPGLAREDDTRTLALVSFGNGASATIEDGTFEAVFEGGGIAEIGYLFNSPFAGGTLTFEADGPDGSIVRFLRSQGMLVLLVGEFNLDGLAEYQLDIPSINAGDQFGVQLVAPRLGGTISFTPARTDVPVPPSAALFAAGIGLLMFARKRT